MAEATGDKIHDATPHRREQAREQGQVARSQDLSSAAMLVAGVVALLWLGGDVARYFAELMKELLGGEAWLRADRDFFTSQWFTIMTGMAKVVLPLLGLLLLAAVLIHVGQVGFLWLPDKVSLDFSRLDPMAALLRMFSLNNLMRLGFGLLKVGLVTALGVWFVSGQLPAVLAATGLDVPQMTAFVGSITLWTCLKIGSALLILSLLDYLYQWWQYEQDLKMTHQEVRDEMKQLQGDPHVAQRRKTAQRQLALNRLKGSVPKADVVVTNPTELAIAIQYDLDTMAAPIVVAKGAGVVAQRIRRLALESNIPIVERKELARLLYKQVEIGQPIPTEQYAAVAEVLRYVYELKGKTAETLRQAGRREGFGGTPPPGANTTRGRGKRTRAA